MFKMIFVVLFKCSLFLYIVGAIPLTNDEINTAKLLENANLRMANPSFIRSVDNPPRQENPLAHKIFNVPTNVQSNYRGIENTPIYVPKRLVEPELYNKELNIQRNRPQSGHQELNRFQTVYLQNPYQNINTNDWRLPQHQDTNFYRQQGTNGQMYNPEYIRKAYEPSSNSPQSYQGSSPLQKLLRNPNIIRNIFSARQQTKRYTVVYPNGTIGYEDNLESIAIRHPNYVVVSYNDLEKLSNIKSENMFSTSTVSQQNMRNYVSSDTPEIPHIGNQSSFTLKNVVSNLPKSESGSQNSKNPSDSLEKVNPLVTELPKQLESDLQKENTKLNTKKEVRDNNLTSTIIHTTDTEQNINGTNNTDVPCISADIPEIKNRNDTLGKEEKIQEHFVEFSKQFENEQQEENTKSYTSTEVMYDNRTNTNKTSIEENISGRNDIDAQNISKDVPDITKRNDTLHNNNTHEPVIKSSENQKSKNESIKPNTDAEVIDKSITNTKTININQHKTGANDTDIQHNIFTDSLEEINTNNNLNKDEKYQAPFTELPKHLENDLQKDDTRTDIKTEITEKNGTITNTNIANMENINLTNSTDIQQIVTDTIDSINDNVHKNEIKNYTTNQHTNQPLTDVNNKTSEVIYNNEVIENDTNTFTDTDYSNNDYNFNDSLENNETENWESWEQYDDVEEDKIISKDDQGSNPKHSDKQSVIWWKPNQEEIKNLLNTATFIFYAPAEIIHKDTKTIIYPNGTTVEIYTETIRNSDDGPTVTITKTTTYNEESDNPDDSHGNNTSVAR